MPDKTENEVLKKNIAKRVEDYVALKSANSVTNLEKIASIPAKNLYNVKIEKHLPSCETLYLLKRWDPLLNLNWLVADSGPALLSQKEYSTPTELLSLVEESNEMKTKYIRSFETINKLRDEIETISRDRDKYKTELDACTKSLKRYVK